MTVMNTFELSLNGKRIDSEAANLQQLLAAQGYALNSAFACAINGSFVPRAHWPDRALQAGDQIDVITPIAGG